MKLQTRPRTLPRVGPRDTPTTPRARGGVWQLRTTTAALGLAGAEGRGGGGGDVGVSAGLTTITITAAAVTAVGGS